MQYLWERESAFPEPEGSGLTVKPGFSNLIHSKRQALAPSWISGRALAIGLTGMPPAGGPRLLLVSWSWSGLPQWEASRESNSVYDGVLTILVLVET